jgi:predicted amidohydrolase
MKIITVILFLFTLSISVEAQETFGLPKIKYINYKSESREWFAKYGQCQISFELITDSLTNLSFVKEPIKQIEKINKCLDIAKHNKFNVIIFPECAISLPTQDRTKVMNIMELFSRENDAIIIAGTYYDENRNSRVVTILPSGTYLGYKIRPSRFEVSPVEGEGMLLADTLLLFKTKYGNFLPITCVDLISDDANYTARNLSNRGIIDILININYNPAAQEFMREASSMVVRHPIFVSITNVSLGKTGCTLDDIEYGNSSIFGSLRRDSQQRLFNKISDCFKTVDKKSLQPAYNSLLLQVNPEIEGILNYEINLRLIRTPSQTNAPDQGYPTIKNLNIINLN